MSVNLGFLESGAFDVIDLGCYLDQAAYPPWGYEVTHIDHDKGAHAIASFFNKRDFAGKDGDAVRPDDFPEMMGMAWSQVKLSDHTGNHIDAPYHFGPTAEGRPAKTIDEVPLEWCMGAGVRLDFRHLQGKDIQVDDLKAAFDRLSLTPKEGMIPLLWTGADAYIDDEEKYWKTQAGLSLDGLNFLLDAGIRLIAIDAFAMDVSYETMKKLRNSDDPQFFPAHMAGRKREHMHLEKLVNLGAIPRDHGFLFAAFPVKLRGGSAGWVRPVALVPKAGTAG